MKFHLLATSSKKIFSVRLQVRTKAQPS